MIGAELIDHALLKPSGHLLFAAHKSHCNWQRKKVRSAAGILHTSLVSLLGVSWV